MKLPVIVLMLLLVTLPLFGAVKEARKMVDKIDWLGHDAFRINGSKVIYLDPFRITGGKVADVILITHAHDDHCSPDDVRKVQGEQTIVIGTQDCLAKLSGHTRAIAPGETISLDGVTITAVPAYNTNKKYHPKQAGWVGYLITIDGVTIYHAGDTDRIPEMKGLKPDIALLPVSGTYVMTADEAACAALDLQPAIAIPMHYGTIVGSVNDAKRFNKVLQGKIAVVIKVKSE